MSDNMLKKTYKKKSLKIYKRGQAEGNGRKDNIMS